jgi:hypothetical protein
MTARRLPISKRLETYYVEHAISPANFRCSSRPWCSAGSPDFAEAKATFVGPRYEEGRLPRLLFLSLNPGRARRHWRHRTIGAVLRSELATDLATLPKNRHWYRTHQLAHALLRQFRPTLLLEEARLYFAHVNSAKCTPNKPGSANTDPRLFEKCRRFIPGELGILRPEIIVTQGNWAREAILGSPEVREHVVQRVDAPGYKHDAHYETALVKVEPGTDPCLWLHTYHPREFGRFNPQRVHSWPRYAKKVGQFWRTQSPRRETSRRREVPAVRGGRFPPPEPHDAGLEVVRDREPFQSGDRSSGALESRRSGTSGALQKMRHSAHASRPSSVAAAKVDTKGLEERADIVIDLFRDLFACEGRRFGSRSLGVLGISDGCEGVQWNAAYHERDKTARLGVNLEGMLYDGWPVARLIEREISHPLLLTEYRGRIPRPEMVTVRWWRDAWQVSSRVSIKESRLPPTPIALDRLDGDGWAHALREARECMDPERGYRGRRRTKVTLRSSGRIVERWVSPHLQFTVRFAENSTRSLRRAADDLQVLREFAVRQTRPGTLQAVS